MKERQFHKIAPPVWRSKRFLSLPDDGRLLWFYYATSPHQTSAGCCRIPTAYAEADLGWSRDRHDKNRQILMDADMIQFDPDTDELFVSRWFQHAAPANAKHAAGIASFISALDSDAVRERAEGEFVQTLWGERFIIEPSCAG